MGVFVAKPTQIPTMFLLHGQKQISVRLLYSSHLPLALRDIFRLYVPAPAFAFPNSFFPSYLNYCSYFTCSCVSSSYWKVPKDGRSHSF